MLQPYLEVLCGESTAAIDYKNSQSIVSKSVYIVRKKEKRKKTIFMKTKVAHFCVNTDILSND